ncbi:MAG TPA: BTAD domain-containing putative transcriptional regulator [Blastocatellia bacterium]|nr:BTAD domain-containing putative transcriptional regulator [Blastocatellia bacterium]
MLYLGTSKTSLKESGPVMPDRSQQTSDARAGSMSVGEQPAFFLRTKLLLPRAAPLLLSRPRLTDQLVSNLTQPVTLVTANAGSGKTTLVADFIRNQVPKHVWYQLEHTDTDPQVFLGYLVHGIRQAIPEFGEAILSFLQQSSDELARKPERAVDVFINELIDTLEDRLVVVLDDYHHLGADTAVHRVVDRLLAYMPDLLHIIIISRDVPPLQLARLRSQNALAVIDRSDLLFTDEETKVLFRQVFDLELGTEQLAEYRERTHGWITALQLVRQVAHRQTPVTTGEEKPLDMVKVLHQSERDIFDYFAEEVFDDESESTRFLLLRVALPERIDAAQCVRLYPEANSRELLSALARRNVFITVAGDGKGEEFRLHPLFQNFLRRRLFMEIGAGGVAKEHSLFAEDFLAHNRLEQAIKHFVHAEQLNRAAQVIAIRGGDWLASGAVASLITSAEALPQTALEMAPRSLFYFGEALRLRGDYTSAQITLNRAVTVLRANIDREGEAEALHSLATIARRRGDYETALSHVDQAMELTDESSPVRIKCGNTRGLCLMAMGDLPAAEREFRTAWQYAVECGDTNYIRLIAHNLGLPAMIRGDFGEAARFLRRMLGEGEDASPMPRDATAHLNLARCCLYQGDFAACEQQLNLALKCSQAFNQVSLFGEIFETYGNYYRESGDYPHAAEYYERAARAYEAADTDVTRHELLEERALLCVRLGDLGTAKSLIDRLIAARQHSDNELALAPARLARGRILLAQDEYQAAWDELEPSAWFFRQRDLKYYEAQTSMALAACAQRLDRQADMVKYLRRSVDLAARYDYEHWLQVEVRKNPTLFLQPEARELLPEDLREQALQQQPAPISTVPAKIEAVQTSVTDLTIKMLGPIEIYRDRLRPFAPDAWTTKRSRDILCFIAAQRHRRASKDVIIDTFWGEVDLVAIEKNFHPTVSHIRKALNSNQPLKLNFVIYRDGAYELNPSFSYSIDTEEFEKLLAQGESAKRSGNMQECARCFEAAIKLYRGEFLEGVYDEWVESYRSHFHEQYLRVMEQLARMALKSEDWTNALQLAQQILREDHLREDIHCIAMRALAAQGNRGAVKEQYESLRQVLRDELDVRPAAETQRVYDELLKS